MIKVEYLFPFNTKDGVCKDISSFNSLLNVHSDINIEDGKIIFRGSEYSYKVNLDEVSNQEFSIFHVTFSSTKLNNNFREMLKAAKQVVGVHIKDNIQIIWDGVGFEWSKELYPKIYQVENNFRKLISKFMLVNLGLGWYKSAFPPEVKETIRNSNLKENTSILYEIDFIQLLHFLFKPYSLKNINDLPAIIEGMLDQELTDVDRKEITNYIPKNNWDRYFSKIVEIKPVDLKKKWIKLNGIRNKIAHNKSLKINDYEEGGKLCDLLLPILVKAINSLEKIEIPNEDRENVSLKSLEILNDSIINKIQDKYSLWSIGLSKDLQNLINERYSIREIDLDNFATDSNLLDEDGLDGGEVY